MNHSQEMSRYKLPATAGLITAVVVGSLMIGPVVAIGATEEQGKIVTSFTDIEVGSSYLVQVNFLREQGIIKGYEDHTFRPNQKISRAEAAGIIKKALIDYGSVTTKTTDTTTDLTFTDVKKTNWAYDSIKELAEKKVINTKEKKFRPNDNVNLAEAVKMIIATEQIKNPALALPTDKKSSFKDMTGKEWFAPYIEVAKTKTLLSYSTKMKIAPTESVTRGEFADLIYRAIKTREPGHYFGRGTFYSDSFQGKGTSNGEKYDMNAYTAANKTLPFGTKIKVTYLRNNQSVTVRINDRGPFTPSLDVDLSRKAFTDLANPSEGIIPIEYVIMKDEEVQPVVPQTSAGTAKATSGEAPVSGEVPPKK